MVLVIHTSENPEEVDLHTSENPEEADLLWNQLEGSELTIVREINVLEVLKLKENAFIEARHWWPL